MCTVTTAVTHCTAHPVPRVEFSASLASTQPALLSLCIRRSKFLHSTPIFGRTSFHSDGVPNSCSTLQARDFWRAPASAETPSVRDFPAKKYDKNGFLPMG
ncbi:hypothetical protein MLD38_013857 [Melastoma candidum]|uniref:Uncharacterized protein n=1 Tax=Melastoma candidum TaxID=119954 RepID=A0ACB9RAJ2_9MYRT|nr:hypothetical protein MLD38_013857 [Melastoma candidum]